MNILIFSGGSGSAAIQQGIEENFPTANVTVITNGYDNGKSTGLIRTVFEGNILGPSDIRKNQLRSLVFKKNQQRSLEFRNEQLAKFLDFRFTSDKPQEAIQKKLEEFEVPNMIKEIIDRYFDNPKSKEISYEDFSIGNIIYGQLAHENNNSMQAAADIMAKEFDIKTNVVVNSDESLFLYAKTSKGNIINDEADIVNYDRGDDKIISIGFKDVNNNEVTLSKMNERACLEVEKADIIIFSSGTQWSSLIPTYQSVTFDGRSFAELINNSKAKKYLVMNTKEDKDMIGVSAGEIQDLNNNYYDVSDVITVVDDFATEGLRKINPIYPYIHKGLSVDKHHEPGLLMDFIISDYFGNPKKEDLFIFDWDDTIVARQGKHNSISKNNKEMINKINSIIISGNTIHHINHKRVWADSGLNFYENGNFVETVDDSLLIENKNEVINILIGIGMNNSMIQDRNGACISLKPIDDKYRKALAELINIKLPSNLKAIISGKTTIDIINKKTDKIYALKRILKENKTNKVFYIGDEPEGNDKTIYNNREELGITFIKVSSVLDTSAFLRIIK